MKAKIIKKETIIAMIIFSLILTIVGFISGVISSVAGGKCSYKSIASFNPARVITCEILRERW
jgi:hypothetical protein